MKLPYTQRQLCMAIDTQNTPHNIVHRTNAPLYFDAITLHSCDRQINLDELNQNYKNHLAGNYENKTSSAIK